MTHCRFFFLLGLLTMSWLPLLSNAAAEVLPGEIFRDRLKDNALGPQMVVIPAGEFVMGSPEQEPGRQDNERQHRVETERSFAIGKYEVTVGEFRYFVEATGYVTGAEQIGGCLYWNGEQWKLAVEKTWRHPGFDQTDNHPVACVNWYDANAYAQWLSQQTGKNYRLPTEAEWEYAARAGTVTRFHFGDTISSEQANYYAEDVYRGKTVPVGQFPANAWGMHDVHGNLWEWTCSRYDKDYQGGERKCLEEEAVFVQRVIRGGSWDYFPQHLRAAMRDKSLPDARAYNVGFRLFREL